MTFGVTDEVLLSAQLSQLRWNSPTGDQSSEEDTF